MLYFKVKIGYGSDDFISVSEEELPMAVRAQITNKVGLFREGTSGGNHIMSIVPDLNRALGFSRAYHMTPEDYSNLGKKREQHLQIMEGVIYRVRKELGLEPEGPPRIGNNRGLQSDRSPN